MSVYYNDNDPFVCRWLENLIAAKLLPEGVVDCRPIEEVTPADVHDFTQCHFFAGIGGWPLALQLAGWGDRPVWTGSCPCQPFSAAGKQDGHEDTRHLWPAWHRLIAECKPPTLFGEQVSSALGRSWLAAVRADLEALDYAVGAADLCAARVGAPHIRQRLWFVADTERDRRGSWRPERAGQCGRAASDGAGATSFVGDAHGGHASTEGLQRSREYGFGTQDRGIAGELADAERRSAERHGHRMAASACEDQNRAQEWQRLRAHAWDGCEFISCTDGKARPVEPGTFPLAHGIPQRVGRLRAYGNAIVPQVAAAFVSAYLDLLT